MAANESITCGDEGENKDNVWLMQNCHMKALRLATVLHSIALSLSRSSFLPLWFHLLVSLFYFSVT